MAAVRHATLTELAEATGVPLCEVRLGLRRLADHPGAARIQVFDDGSHVRLAPETRFRGAAAYLVQPQQLPRLTQEQAEVLTILWDGEVGGVGFGFACVS